MDDTEGAPQPEANGNADIDEEEQHSNEDEGIPSTVPHAEAPQESPNLLDQPRYIVVTPVIAALPADVRIPTRHV